jgi:DNA-binding IclR family transcriptional regulator
MNERYTVPALQRGLQVLGLFNREHKQFTGAELAQLLDLPRASVFRILQTLEQGGFIERMADSSRYRLGVAVLRLGFEYLASMEITEHSRPVLYSLRDATSYAAHLVVRDSKEVVIVAKAPGFAKLFNSIQIGARLPAHATVLGRVLLCKLPHETLTELYGNSPLKQFTSTTPTSLSALSEMLRAVSENGYGLSEGGFETSISTIAAPVYGPHGEVTAAVSIAVPTSNIEASQKDYLINQVKNAAQQLTQRLGNPRQSSEKLAA